MIIKECYIENFGIFHQQKFSFTNGFHLINEKNGWGKSTLAAFLKAMFYGLNYPSSTKLEERTRYQPWQGGIYGGWIIFETQGISYKIIRFFRENKAADEFELYNMTTNLPSKDYSAQIGEELFGIDCDSFERSIFVSSNNQKFPTLQDNLRAKLKSLTNFSSSLNTQETNNTKINSKEIIEIKLENQIKLLKEELLKCQQANSKLPSLQLQMEKCCHEIDNLEIQKQEIQAKISSFDLESVEANQKEWNQLVAKKNTLEKKLQEKHNIFHNSLPTEETLQHCIHLSKDIKTLKKQLKNSPITEKERLQANELWSFFSPQIPTKQETSECQNILEQCQILKQKLAKNRPSDSEISEYQSLSKKYKGRCPSLETLDYYITQIYQADQLKEIIASLKTDLKQLKQKKQNFLMEQEKRRQFALEAASERKKTMQARMELDHQQALEQKEKAYFQAASKLQKSFFFFMLSLILLFIGVFLNIAHTKEMLPSSLPGTLFLIAGLFFLLPALFLSLSSKKVKTETHFVKVKNFIDIAEEDSDNPNPNFETSNSEIFDSENADSEVFDSENADSEVFNSENADSEVFDPENADSEIFNSENVDSEVFDSKTFDSENFEETTNNYEEDMYAIEEQISNLTHQLYQLNKQKQKLEQEYLPFLQDFFSKEDITTPTNILPFINNSKTEIARLLTLRQQFQTYQQFCDRIKPDLDTYQSSLDSFLSRFRSKCPNLSDNELLVLLEEKKADLKILQQGISEYDHANHALQQKTDILSHFFEYYTLPENLLTISEKINYIEEAFRDTQRLQQEQKELLQQQNQFTATHNMEALQQNLPLHSLEKLQQQALEYDQKLQHLKEKKASYQKELNVQSSLADNILDLEWKLQQEQKKMEQLQESNTKWLDNCLQEIQNSFDKYLYILDPDSPAVFLSSNLEATIEQNGKLHKIEYFNTGYQDLINLCIRLALIDVMFPQESPFLILDNPFINLDTNTLAQVTTLLSQLGKQYQILYFTCHSSRILLSEK